MAITRLGITGTLGNATFSAKEAGASGPAKGTLALLGVGS